MARNKKAESTEEVSNMEQNNMEQNNEQTATNNVIEFTLFSNEGKGKRSDNAPCKVIAEAIDFDKLSVDQKNDLVLSLIKTEARRKYAKMSAGYNQLQKFMDDARGMLAAFGLDGDEEKVKIAAIGLAKRDEVILAFEPVVEFTLTADEVLAESKKDSNGQ